MSAKRGLSAVSDESGSAASAQMPARIPGIDGGGRKYREKMKNRRRILSHPICAVENASSTQCVKFSGMPLKYAERIPIIGCSPHYATLADRRARSGKVGGRVVQKIGAPIAKAAVYAFALAFWAFSMLFTYNLMEVVLRGHIEKYGLALFAFMFGCAVLFGEFSRYLIRLGVPKAAALFQPEASGNTAASTLNPLTTKEPTAMAKNETPPFTFSGDITFNASTNHNAPGGIIGNAPITIHQHFGKPPPTSSTIDAEIIEKAAVVPKTETASIEQLVAYTETLMGRAVAENTVRNVLERNAVESCDGEKRGRAWAKLYPKERAEKVLADYVTTSKRKR